MNTPEPTAREIPTILKLGFLASAAADADAEILAVALADIDDMVIRCPMWAFEAISLCLCLILCG